MQNTWNEKLDSQGEGGQRTKCGHDYPKFDI